MSRIAADDSCPGALYTHQAADGPLARIRLPGGQLRPDQLESLARAATRFGAGTLELTGRGNIQVRGITDTAALAGAVAAAGLLPSAGHERVRNIVASPLSGRLGGEADVRPRIGELDRAIRDDPALTRLPGRFLFALDDGRGDVAGLAADTGAQALPDGSAALLLAGRDSGIRLPGNEVVPALLGVARRFTEVRGNAWRVAELDDPAILAESLAEPLRVPVADRLTVTPAARPPVGWLTQDDGRVALGAAVPLGVLAARQAEFVAAVGAPVVITPWRSLLVCDLDDGVADAALRVLAPLGLVFDENSPWLGVSACVGSPGCARSRADVRAEATRAAAGGTDPAPVHFAGCERACGRPAAGTVLVATGQGYLPLHPSAPAQ